MRRAQSLRSHNTRAAAASSSSMITDDLSVLHETSELGEMDWKALYEQEKKNKELVAKDRDDVRPSISTSHPSIY